MPEHLVARCKDYWDLCKPRVVLLMLVTVLVGMYLATPHSIHVSLILLTLIGVGLSASSAATMNHLLDRHIDSLMARTKNRPVAHGRVAIKQAFIFACTTGALGLLTLAFFVNGLTALLTAITLMGYAGIYTGFLKRATPQNIVIGGLAGAAPPLLGWTAVTNQLDPQALLLVLIIFTWTPPHFWALAIYRLDEYQHAKIPMLPVTHGIKFTKLNIFLYVLLLFVASLFPFLVGMSGFIYLVAAIALGTKFLWMSYQLYCTDQASYALKTFKFSIIYLLLLFVFLLTDHFVA